MQRIRSILSLVFLIFLRGPFANANVVGSDAQNFNPTTSGLDFVTVQSSATLEPGVFNLGLFANYAKNPLPYYDASGGSKRSSSLTGGDLNFGYGILKGWDFGLSLPFILNQQVDADSSTGHFSSNGNTEVRVNTKYRFFGNQRHGFALIASANFNRIKDNPYVGEKGGPIYNLEMAYKSTFGLVAWGLNLGYRSRNSGKPIANSGIEPLPDQWLASTALSYLIEDIDTKIILEVLGAFPKENKSENATDRQTSVLEALFGLKYDNSTNLSFHLGGGGGLIKGTSSPDYRVYLGMNIAFGSIREKASVQTDPYATPRPRRPLRVAREEMVAKPSAPPIAKVVEELVEEKETPAAVSSETVKEVKVFNRGVYNHIVLQNIKFIGKTMTLKPESQQYLINELAPAIRELNSRRAIAAIVVEGHTDSLGNKAQSLQLTKARAQIVSALLRQRLGLKISIQAVGRGGTKPIADNGNYQGRAQNERVEIKLLYQTAR